MQYGNHAGVIAALNQDSGESIKEVIKEIISHEVHHAILLTDILKKNNVEPTVAVWPPQTADTTDEMIQKDITAETSAITLYQQILTLNLDDQIKKTIENIMWSEEHHRHMFTEILPELS